MELAEKRSLEVKEVKSEITFRCKICGKTKPLSQLRELKRFFPVVVACSECEEKMCGSGRIITRF